MCVKACVLLSHGTQMLEWAFQAAASIRSIHQQFLGDRRLNRTRSTMAHKLHVIALLLLVARLSDAIRCDLQPPTSEGRLRKQLFCKFDQLQMPVPGGSQLLNVSARVQVKDFYVVSAAESSCSDKWRASTSSI